VDKDGFRNRSRHKHKSLPTICGQRLRGQFRLNEKVSPPRTAPTSMTTRYRATARIFFVSEKRNFEKRRQGFSVSADKFLIVERFHSADSNLDFDSTSFQRLVYLDSLASWTIFGVDTKTVDIEVSDEANCW